MEWWHMVTAAAALIGIGAWVGSVNSDRKNFREFMIEVRDDIKEILARIQPSATGSKSPIQLTTMGEEISVEIGAKSWASHIASSLADDLKGKSEYEIQEACFEHARNIPLKETRSSFQVHTANPYATPELHASLLFRSAYKHGIKIEGVLEVLGVELRDAVFSKLGITPEE